ncbi:MAG: hypothetical protein AMXMBFR36_23290 [Acidobacteriota bacterium]
MFRFARILFALVTGLAFVAAPVEAVKRRAFVTSVSGTGNLSTWIGAGGLTGVAAADNVCRVRAVAGGLPNAATYRAWLSTSTTDAYCHVQGLTGKKATGCNGASQPGAGPWYQANGATYFATSLSNLTGTDGTIFFPVLWDEFFDPIPEAEPLYWTGTGSNGAGLSTHACNDWSSGSAGALGARGTALGTAVAWTYLGWNECSVPHRLLCLEPGASEPQGRIGWQPGSLVFVTSATGSGDLSTWAEAGGAAGLEAGDNICQYLAAAAHLPAPESFVAWLSDAQVDARDRLTGNGPYRRVDSVRVADSKADLLDGTSDNSIHVFEDGRYLTTAGDVRTGTDQDGVLKTPNCSDWTSGLNGDLGAKGVAGLSRSLAWTENAFINCSSDLRLYCFSNVVTIFWDGFELTGDTSHWSADTP